MLAEILHNADQFRDQVAELKKKAPIFPELYTEEMGNVFWVTTLVPFNRSGVRFYRHHVESGVLNKHTTKDQIIFRINYYAKLCQEEAVPCKYDDVAGILDDYESRQTN